MKRRNLKRKVKKYRWIIVLIITVIGAMYVYGMAKHYFPEPMYLGVGQYMDIATGIIIVGLLLAGTLTTTLFKKNKKKRRQKNGIRKI